MCSSNQDENRNQRGEIIALLYEKRDLHNNIKANIVLTVFAYTRDSKNMWMDSDIIKSSQNMTYFNRIFYQ